MSVRTFLIADIRGYSRFTAEYGDEAAGRLAVRFAGSMREGVEAHGGTLIDVRGDEGVAVFASARQAIRAAVALQARFAEETKTDPELPLSVGIGIDSGEAVQLEDGTFRGSALNVASRLCARANGGEVVVTAATSTLAGRIPGLRYSDRGRVRLKNIPDAIHILHVSAELDAQSSPWRPAVFARRFRPRSWRLGLAVVLAALVTAPAAVYVASGDRPESGQAVPLTGGKGGAPIGSGGERVRTALEAVVPRAIWKDCELQAAPAPKATETAVCLPGEGLPDRWEISAYRSGAALAAAYERELRRATGIGRDTGRCNAFAWGGEREWLHGPDKPGGRAFCYFDGNDAVIVWTHARLDQPTHLDVLVRAREGGSDHVGLTRWWRPWHHLIGKAQDA